MRAQSLRRIYEVMEIKMCDYDFDYDDKYWFCEGCGLLNADCICHFTEQDWKNYERQERGPDKCPFCDAPLKGNQYYIQTGQCELCNKEIIL